MHLTVEGFYKDGKVVLNELPEHVEKAKVLVTFLTPVESMQNGRQMNWGQFLGAKFSTDEDFLLAEWRGETELRNGS